MAEVTVSIPSNVANITSSLSIVWGQEAVPLGISLGSSLSTSGSEIFLNLFELPRRTSGLGSATKIFLSTTSGDTQSSQPGPEFSDQMEASGTITITASNGSSLVLTGISDSVEPYSWIPSNISDVVAFADTIAGLSSDQRGITVTFNDNSSAAPSFADDTGDAQSWAKDQAITAITVPAATGSPTPTYAVVGNLPAGISFDTSTRVISGTPTAASSGTITIRATNSEGSDDWTVAYSIIPPLSNANFSATGHVSLLVRLNVGRAPRTGVARQVQFYATDGFLPETGTILEGDFDYDPATGTSFDNIIRRIMVDITTSAMAMNRHRSSSSNLGTIVGNENVTIVRNTNPVTLITLEAGTEDGRGGGFAFWGSTSGSDGLSSTEWTFLNAIKAGDEIIVAFHGGTASYSAPVAASFADDTGVAQQWTVGTAIADVTVPAATGSPTPTYAVVGNLPAGISFDVATRVISGTPTAAGSGTITIRATNSQGSDDWTVAYAITASAPAQPVPPTLTIGDGTVSVTGVDPSDGGSPITNRDVRFKLSSDTSWTERLNVGAFPYHITNLTNGQQYDVQWRAKNTTGAGDWSPSATATPISSNANLSDLVLSGINIGTFDENTVSYNVSVDNSITETTVTATPAGTGATYIVQLGGVTDADRTISLAVGANVITIRVTAQDTTTTRTYTVTVTRRTPSSATPAKPTGLSGTVNLNGSITLTWDDPSDPNIIGYQILRRRVGVDSSLAEYVANTGTTSTTWIDTDILLTLPPTTHAYRVAAINSHGTSVVSDPVTVLPLRSGDATLTDLQIDGATVENFDRNTFVYAFHADRSTTITITATTFHLQASYSIRLDGVAVAGEVVTLHDGLNTISVDVVSQNGNITQSYLLNVTRSSIPRVTGLVVSVPGLRPVFEASTKFYALVLPYEISQISLIATHTASILQFVSHSQTNYSVSPAVRTFGIPTGPSSITIRVSDDEGNFDTYTIGILRADAPVKDPDLPEVSGPIESSFIIRELDAGKTVRLVSQLHEIDRRYLIETYQLEHMGGQAYKVNLTLRSYRPDTDRLDLHGITSYDLQGEEDDNTITI